MSKTPTEQLNFPESGVGPRRSRKGCQQCRKRKRKCDEQHPRCAACVSRDSACEWGRNQEPKQQLARRSTKCNKDFTVAAEVRPHITIFAVPSPPVRERLVSYFNKNSALWMTVGSDERQSAAPSDVIIPIALRNPLVLNCILAMSAGDLSKFHPASAGYEHLTNGFYGQAVSGVHSSLSESLVCSDTLAKAANSGHEDELLLAIMLLGVHEAVNFTTADRLLPHLNAAAFLCHNRSTQVTSDPRLRGLIFELFFYQFTLAAFSHHGRNLPLHLALQVINSPYLSGGYRGILLSERCMKVFSCILQLAMLTNTTSTACLSVGEEVANKIVAIENELSAFLALQQQDPAIPVIDEDIASELYRIASLIHIKRLLDPKAPAESKEIQELVGRFVTTLGSLPPRSHANNILCWPLVVAGLSSVAVAHRRLIVGRLRKNYEIWRSDILSKSAEFPTRKWRSLDLEMEIEAGTTGKGLRRKQANVQAQVQAYMSLTDEIPIVLL